MINNKLDYAQCKKYAERLPGWEHTRLRTLNELETCDDVVVCCFGEEKPKEADMLLSVKRDATGKLKAYFSKGGLSHSLVIGNTGSGKSQGFLLNSLMALDGTTTCVVADVKGELYAAGYNRLCEKYGAENVKTINFMQPQFSDYHINYLNVLAQHWLDTYNSKRPADEKRAVWENVVSQIQKYLNLFFIVQSQKDPTWEQTAKSFIFSIILGMYEDLTVTPEESARSKRSRTTPEMINFEAVNKIFHTMKWERSFEDKGFFSSRKKGSLALQHAQSIISNASTTRANYLGFVDLYLKSVCDPLMTAVSAYNDFDVESLGDTPQVLFLIYDISNEAVREYVNKILAHNVNLLLESTHKKVKPLAVPVRFFLDEFSTLKPNPVYPNVLATGRGSNLYLSMIVQSYSQLKARYPDEYDAMIENCNYTYFIGTNNAETAKKFSDELGQTTIPNPVNFLHGDFTALTVPVVSQDELLHKLKPGEVLIKINRRQPVRGHFEFFYLTAEYTAYSSAKKISKTENKAKCVYNAPWMSQDNNDDDDDYF